MKKINRNIFYQGASFFIVFSALLVSACTPNNFSIFSKKEKKTLPKNQSFKTIDIIKKNDRLAQLAALQHPRILATYGGEYVDVKLEHMIAKIVGNLTTVAENPKQNYRITILNSPSINAFALPGGYLYITRGLLALANDSSEIAAVLAHEMGHVTASHALTRQKLELEEKIIEKVTTTILNKSSSAKAAAVHEKLRLAQFSRNQELEADAIGIKSTGQAGYDTYAAQRFLISMAAYAKLRSVAAMPDNLSDFLSTHPSTPHRIELAEHYANIFQNSKRGKRDRDAFLDGINGLVFGNSPEHGYVRDGVFVHPNFRVAFRLPYGFVIDNTNQVMAASGPESTAIRFDCIKNNAALVDYLRSGWVSGLEESSIEKIIINGQEAAIAKAYVQSWQFDITLIKEKNTTCRLLSAVPVAISEAIEPAIQVLRSTLRFLSPFEKLTFKPLRIRIITVKPGDTVSSLSSKMKGTEQKEEFFRVLNALSENDTVIPSERVKIITD